MKCCDLRLLYLYYEVLRLTCGSHGNSVDADPLTARLPFLPSTASDASSSSRWITTVCQNPSSRRAWEFVLPVETWTLPAPRLYTNTRLPSFISSAR